MADSLFASLLNMLDPRDIRGIGSALGEPEQSVSRCLQSSIAAVMGSLAGKAGDPGALRKTLDLLPSGLGDFGWSNAVETASDPQSPGIAIGRRIVSGLFGPAEGTVQNAIGTASGLRPNVVSTLLSVVAPLCLSFIGRRVRDDGLTMSGLGNILQRESGAIRNALPAGLSEVFWPRAAAAATTSPVIAQEVKVERSRNWVAPIALGALALGLFWLLNHARRPVQVSQQSYPSGTASRAAPEPVRRRPVPEIPKERVVPSTANRAVTVSNLDLKYATGSTKLTPESQKRLDHLVAQLAASPNAKVKVEGFTDTVGSADQNLQISQKRADNVMAILIHKGVPPARVTAKGHGEETPIANNSTKEGRAQNRRVTVSVE